MTALATLGQFQGELDLLATQLGRLAASNSVLLACAESCTGGAIACALTETAGSSEWFDRGFITYSNEAKTEMLGVPADLIATHGAVSEPVVRLMAGAAIARSGAGLSVAVTGVAGPGGGSEDKPVGTVWFGWGRREATGQISIVSQRLRFEGPRSAVRLQTGLHGLALLLKHLNHPTALPELGLNWAPYTPSS